MSKIVTLGEIMLRLSPQGSKRFVQVDSFDVIWGGGEANVAVSCANYGHDAYFVSKLPAHEIGQAAVNAPRRYGVHTDYVGMGSKLFPKEKVSAADWQYVTDKCRETLGYYK